MYLVYKHTSPSGKSYIGKTNNYELRSSRHKKSAENGSKITFHRAIRKYGWDNFTHEILIDNIETNLEVLSVEKFYVSFYDSFCNGYNETKGGEGSDGFTHTEETKRIMSKIAIERMSNNTHVVDTSGFTSFTNIDGNILQLAVDDDRVKSGEYFGIRKGLKFENRNTKGQQIKINIYNADDELMFECFGNYKATCSDNNLPICLLSNTIKYNNMISFNFNGKRPCDITRIKNGKKYQFDGWYARKLSKNLV